jgi:hypothetical protein
VSLDQRHGAVEVDLTEMTTALRTRSGEVWGALGLYRQPDRPLFDADEKAFLAAISPLMADAVRRALLIGESADPEGPDAPGMSAGPRLAPGVDVARCRRVASRPAGRKLGGLAAADGCARRGGTRCAVSYEHRQPDGGAVARYSPDRAAGSFCRAYRSLLPTVSALLSSSSPRTQVGSPRY